MIVRIGDQHHIARHAQPERVLQADRIAHAVDVAEREQIAAGQGPHLIVRRQRQRTDDVGFGVGDVERAVEQGESGRLRERRLVHVAVVTPLRPRAGVADDQALLRIEQPDLVRPGHGDEEQAAVPRDVPGRVE